jgi:predicted alpha/beta-fold hydrolase
MRETSISQEGESISATRGPQAVFTPAPWLPGPHLQTVWGNLTRNRRSADRLRETLETPDGDELVLDRLEPPHAAAAGTPRLLVLHGLEGSSDSVYVHGLMGLARARNWRAIALNFRSCARMPGDTSLWIPNRRPRLYHSGETTDLGFVLERLSHEEAEDPSPLLVAGVSLGGNVLLKWLGENPAQTIVRAAAVISVPFDLGAGGRYMETGLGPLYVRHLLSTLRRKAVDLAARFPEAASKLDVPALLAAKTFFAFDDAATAPLHGFAGAQDYYERSSSLRFVGRIATPTLAISAQDDPFLPARVLEDVAREKSAAVELLVTRHGGHAGFVGGTWRPRYWAEERAVEWLASRL